jgi:hypothetical protein
METIKVIWISFLLLSGCITLTPMQREEIKVCKHLGGTPQVKQQQGNTTIHCTELIKQTS